MIFKSVIFFIASILSTCMDAERGGELKEPAENVEDISAEMRFSSARVLRRAGGNRLMGCCFRSEWFGNGVDK